jgi:hypothetical protein
VEPSVGASSTTTSPADELTTSSAGFDLSSSTAAATSDASSTTPATDPDPSPTDDVPLLFTGVTATATTSATNCYVTPTPTDALEEANLSGLSTELEGYSMFITPDGDPVYLRMAVDGVEYLVDTRNPEQLIVIDPNGNTLTLDDTGLLFADDGCATQVHISVPGLFAQLATLDDSTLTRRKRDAQALVPPRSAAAVYRARLGGGSVQ